MNLKKKISVFGVTSLIALGSISAASAQTTNVDLVDDVAGAGCTVSITSGAAITFADVEWNGTAYDTTSVVAQPLTYTVADDRAPGEGDLCNVLISATDLTTGLAPFTNRTIGVANIILGASQALSTSNQAVTGSPFAAGPQTTTIDILDAAFVNTLELGTYAGVITISASNVAP